MIATRPDSPIKSLGDLIAQAKARGQEVIVVSSGAIALGAARLGLDKGGRGSLADAQAAAAVGQIALSGLWADLLGAHGITAAQLLLTLEDLEDRRRYLNATATLTRLLDAGLPESPEAIAEMKELARNDELRAYILYIDNRPVSDARKERLEEAWAATRRTLFNQAPTVNPVLS